MSVQSVGKLGWEIVGFSFGMVMRFLGRYPETARSYYKPPEDEHGIHSRSMKHEHGIHALLDLTYSHVHPSDMNHRSETGAP
ncbi:hypothetical protein Mapa_013454 [Marchantia paleacea]|nr:hypothetical protein Mapa_013454 [Marchantia paleacea]